MNKTRPCQNNRDWPKHVRCGREVVAVYRRNVNGKPYFLVPDHTSGRRRLRSFVTEAEAVEAAQDLARQLSTRQVIAAGLTNREAGDYVAAVERLKPHNLSLLVAVDGLAEALKTCGNLQTVLAACKEYDENHKAITPKRVAEAVKELIETKQARGVSSRYLSDLRHRLGKLARAIVKNLHEVTVRDVQTWLDSVGGAPQTYTNNRRVAGLLFEFGQARGWCRSNAAFQTEVLKPGRPPVDFYTVSEMRKILDAADADVLPIIVLGAFCGLRSSELERLDWADVDLKTGTITVGADKTKCASRRVVPMPSNLRAWLAPYAGKTDKVWPHDGWRMYRAVTAAIRAAGVKPKPNALRHSYATYRFAQTNDAGRVSGELGNSPGILHKHYRNLAKPQEAERFFAIAPARAANVVQIAADR